MPEDGPVTPYPQAPAPVAETTTLASAERAATIKALKKEPTAFEKAMRAKKKTEAAQTAAEPPASAPKADRTILVTERMMSPKHRAIARDMKSRGATPQQVSDAIVGLRSAEALAAKLGQGGS